MVKKKITGKKALGKKVVHGDDLLYHFFLHLSEVEPDRFRAIAQSFVESMGIWLPIEVYQQSPVLRPWVVRDPDSHGNASKGIKYRWGQPNDDGYLQDDNTQIKDPLKGKELLGPRGSHLTGKRMGTEFVASHIWRKTSGGTANLDPLLNSFVPNLVWLPSQISKLSDRDGEIVQLTLKLMSRKIYRDVEVEPHLQPVVEEAWSKLESPNHQLPAEFDMERLNWFSLTDRWLAERRKGPAIVVDVLERIAANEPLGDALNPERYRNGLKTVTPAARERLSAFLSRFIAPSDSSA